MARVALTVETPGSAGLAITQTAIATDGHSCILSKDLQVLILNGATALVLTLPTPLAKDGLAVAERTISIAANEERVINFRDVDLEVYVQSDGSINFDYDDVSDGTISVWR